MPNASLEEIMGLVNQVTRGEPTHQDLQGPKAIPHRAFEQKPIVALRQWQPKRLTPKHRQILSLYAQSMKIVDICALCKVTQPLIHLLVKSDLGRAYLAEVESVMDTRLRALYAKSIDAIEDQLDNGKGENKLKAAALQMRAIGKLGADAEDKETAEDVVQRIMNMQVNGDVNVHYHGNGGGNATGRRNDPVRKVLEVHRPEEHSSNSRSSGGDSSP